MGRCSSRAKYGKRQGNLGASPNRLILSILTDSSRFTKPIRSIGWAVWNAI